MREAGPFLRPRRPPRGTLRPARDDNAQIDTRPAHFRPDKGHNALIDRTDGPEKHVLALPRATTR